MTEIKEYSPDNDKFLHSVLVKDLDEKIRAKIDVKFHEQTVFFATNNSRLQTFQTLVDILNERFIRRQLGLKNQPADNRDLWYQCLSRNGTIDIKGKSLQQQISFDGAVRNYCEKLTDFFGSVYWGYIQDELNISSKGRSKAFTIQGKQYVMDIATITEKMFGSERNDFYDIIHKTPFFFLICEKEQILKLTIDALNALGYNEGWLGIVTQGYAATPLIKILMEYQKVIAHKFYVFVLHDFDIDGIKIMLDMHRYFDCESAGLNPELIRRSGLNLTGLGQDYKTDKGRESTLKGAMTMLSELKESKRLNDEQYNELEQWINECSLYRYEIQTITGHRLDTDTTDLNPARDFAEYIADKLESIHRVYDLNRLQRITPDYPDSFIRFEFEKPAFIHKTLTKIQESIDSTIESFLESNSLKSTEDWRDLLSKRQPLIAKYRFYESIISKVRSLQRSQCRIKAIRIRKEHKKYDKSIKDARKTIDNKRRKQYTFSSNLNTYLRKRQNRQKKMIERLLKKLPEYVEVRAKFKALKEKVRILLENMDNIENIEIKINLKNGDGLDEN